MNTNVHCFSTLSFNQCFFCTISFFYVLVLKPCMNMQVVASYHTKANGCIYRSWWCIQTAESASLYSNLHFSKGRLCLGTIKRHSQSFLYEYKKNCAETQNKKWNLQEDSHRARSNSPAEAYYASHSFITSSAQNVCSWRTGTKTSRLVTMLR